MEPIKIAISLLAIVSPVILWLLKQMLDELKELRLDLKSLRESQSEHRAEVRELRVELKELPCKKGVKCKHIS